MKRKIAEEMVKCPECGWQGPEARSPFFCPECKKEGREIPLKEGK